MPELPEIHDIPQAFIKPHELGEKISWGAPEVKDLIDANAKLNKLLGRAKESIQNLQDEIDRLKVCAKAQAKGPGGSKTLRLELVPDGNRLSVIATFPSSMEDGEQKAAESAASALALVIETHRVMTEHTKGDMDLS